MNRELYKNNIKALSKHNKFLTEIIKRKDYKLMDNIEVCTQTAKTGELIFKVKDKEKVLYLNAKYNPEAILDKWFQKQKKFEYESVVFVIGFGNAMYLKRLIKETKQSVIIMVYEPCINIFLKAMEEIDLVDVFENRPIAIAIDGINDEEIKSILEKIIKFDNITLTHNLILENYDQLFPGRVMKFLSNERNCIDSVTRNWRTIVRFTDVNGENVLNNITYLYDNYTIYQLTNLLNNTIPSIIVSAGPSLNKNILELKKAKNKSCIIATDTAIKPLLNNDIIPDFVVTVDGKKDAILFEHSLLSEVPMVMSSVVAKEAVNMHKGKKYFSWDRTAFEVELIKCAKQKSAMPNKVDMSGLSTGGSVANSAFSFAKMLGSKVVILVGQDLALTGNRTHADGTFQEKMEVIDTSNSDYFEVEDIYGGTVLTRADFKLYLDWFGEEIESDPDIKVIDATEGGAKIKGTQILTLKETIERECTQVINIKAMLEEIPPVFSEEPVKEKVREFYQDIPRRFLEVKKKVKQGITYYDKMLKISENDNFNKQEFLKIIKKIKKINKFIDYDGVALIVIDCLRDVDYSLRPTIYKTEDNDKDERIMIAKQGKIMLEAMIPCIDRLVKIAEETVGKVGL